MFDPAALLDAVRLAAGRPEVAEAVRGVYDDVARAVEARRPVCSASGRCCRFEAYGHRLYVTTIELAAFVRAMREAGRGVTDPAATPGACPLQVDGLCSVHPIRPFGCRMFYCDPEAQAWQEEHYRAFHGRLRRLHEELGVPYAYVEWRQALAAIVPLLAGEVPIRQPALGDRRSLPVFPDSSL